MDKERVKYMKELSLSGRYGDFMAVYKAAITTCNSPQAAFEMAKASFDGSCGENAVVKPGVQEAVKPEDPVPPVANPEKTVSDAKPTAVHSENISEPGIYVEPPPIVVVGEAKRPRKKAKPGELVSREVFAGKAPISERGIIQWVFEHLDLEVEPEDAPSSGAWSLLNSIRANDQLRLEFFKTIWPKLLPTKNQFEAAERFQDDGRETFEIIDKVMRAGQEVKS
jgi:hypothetical protein